MPGARTRDRQVPLPGTGGVLLVAAIILASIFYAVLIVRMEGDARVLWVAIIPLLGLMSIASPRLALYLLLGSVLISDPQLTPWFQPFQGLGPLLNHPHSWLILSPLELLLLFALIGSLLHARRQGTPSLSSGPFVWSLSAFLLFVLAGFLLGILRGGDGYVALWEVRAIIYLPVTYVLFYNTVRTKRELQTAAWIALLSIAVSAFLVDWTYLVILGGSLGRLEALTNHQASVFFALFLLAAAVRALYGPSRREMLTLAALSPMVLMALVVNNRRASYFALLLGAVVLLVLLRQDHRQAVLKLALVAGLLSISYAAAFWNSSALLAKPIQGLKSLNAEPGTRNYASNFYRVLENRDISATIHGDPLLGVGFGRKYEQPFPLPYVAGPFRQYMTHNSVLWIWLKTGGPGFVAMLTFLGLAVARAANLFRRDEDQRVKPLLAEGLSFLMLYMVYSYVDEGWDYKGMVYMGVVLGNLAAAQRSGAREKCEERGLRGGVR